MKRYISNESDAGVLWFFETSYNYINPRGILGHMLFAFQLPMATLKFCRSMKG